MFISESQSRKYHCPTLRVGLYPFQHVLLGKSLTDAMAATEMDQTDGSEGKHKSSEKI